MYSSTSAMETSVVTMIRCGACSNTRRAARPATAESNTLLSAATLLKGSEVTLDLLIGHSARIELLADLLCEIEEDLATDLHGDLFRIVQRIENGGLFPMTRYEYRLIAFEQLGHPAAEVTN